jgi:polygalacturonase
MRGQGIEMKSDVTLVVHAGATINASATLADWKPRRLVLPACATAEPAELEHGVLGGLFYASLARNFTIRGPGAVNGAAKAWNGYGLSSSAAAIDGVTTTAVDKRAAPPPPNPFQLIRSNMFVFSQCADVVVEDLLIQDSSAWTLNPQYSQRVSFRRLHIDAPALGTKGHNTDGFGESMNSAS